MGRYRLLAPYQETDRKAMFAHIEEQNRKIEALLKQVHELTVNYSDLELQYRILNEKYKKAIAAKYQSQKNNVVLDMPTLFDDVEEEAIKIAEEECEEVITIGEHERIRRPKEKHIDYSHLERRYETAGPVQGDDICPECGSKMHVKSYEEKEELVYIPAEVFVRVTRIPVYECLHCEEVSESGKPTYKPASHRNHLFPRSRVSPELQAYILDLKYNDGLPLHAIEKRFERINVCIPKQNMTNWVIGSVKYLQPLYDLMKEDLFKMAVICADETTTQVLGEDGKPATSTSYMWVYRTAPGEVPIVLYDYQPSRSGDCAARFLEGYSGYLETDRYDGYNKVENVIRSACNMHGLKYFKEAYKLLPNDKSRSGSDEALAIAKYQEIFHRENIIQEEACRKYPDKERRYAYIQKRRGKELKPKFEAFFVWLEQIQNRNTGKYTMSRAINYMLSGEEQFMRFIDDGHIPSSNIICEQAIRPFTVIRNRCKFYVSPRGAHASALIYSIMISANQSSLNLYMYFTYLFEKLPNMDLTDKEGLRKLLPYSGGLPSYTRLMSKKEIKAILKESQQ